MHPGHTATFRLLLRGVELIPGGFWVMVSDYDVGGCSSVPMLDLSAPTGHMLWWSGGVVSARNEAVVFAEPHVNSVFDKKWGFEGSPRGVLAPLGSNSWRHPSPAPIC